ncbi:MDR family MFS transporter [Streptomyces sp. SD31]|uniref:MDR family MFS transporter n=1 Tax=Streptomyces sp. SD31 TaxID=3452208 RepID=UPI003F8C5F13
MPDEQPKTGSPEPEDAPEQQDEHAGVLRTLRELPNPVRVLLFGVALNRMGSFVALFLVLYLTDIGYSPSRAGLVLTAFGVGTIAGSFLGGTVTGRFGPRRAIVGSMVLSGVATAWFGFVDQYALLVVISLAAGTFTQVYRPAASTLLAELTPPKRLVMASAATRLGLNVGASAGPLLGVWLSGYSYTGLFLVNAATNLGFALVALLALPETGRGGAEAEAPEKEGKAKGAGKSGGGYLEVLRDRRFLLVIVAMFLTAFTEAQYQAVLPLEIKERGLSTALYGTVLALNGALVIIFELPLTRFTQKLPMHTMIAFGSLLIGGGLSLFGIGAGIWIFFMGTIVWTLGEIISAPSIVAYPALAAPREQLRSRYIGALTTAQTAGYAVGPSVGTALFQYSGTAVWAMCAVLGLIAFAGMWAGAAPGPERSSGAAPGDPREAETTAAR